MCVVCMFVVCVRMYDVDGNGWIDLGEMTRLVGSIYKMLGQHQLVQQVSNQAMYLLDNHIFLFLTQETANERARSIFEKMDIDSDGRVTREEFMRSCLEDDNMMNLLTPPG